MQQNAPLEVLSAGPQRGGVPGDPDHLPLDAVQHVPGQHHVGPADPRPGQERGPAPGRRAVLGVEREDLAAVDVVFGGQPPHLTEQLPGPGLAGPGHLEPDRLVRAAVLGPAEQQGEPLAAVLDQVDAAADARVGGPAGPGGPRLGGDAAHPRRAEQRVRRAVAEQVGQPGLPVPGAGDAEQFVRPGPGWPARPRRRAARSPGRTPGQDAVSTGQVAACGPRWASSARRNGASCTRAAAIASARLTRRPASRPALASSGRESSAAISHDGLPRRPRGIPGIPT